MSIKAVIAVAVFGFAALLLARADAIAHGGGGMRGVGLGGPVRGVPMHRFFGGRHGGLNRGNRDFRAGRFQHGDLFGRHEHGRDGRAGRWNDGRWHSEHELGHNGRWSSRMGMWSQSPSFGEHTHP